MRITNSKYNLVIETTENESPILVVESPEFLRDIIENLNKQIEGEDGDFLISEGEKNVKIEKDVYLIIDPFNININDKKIISKLYSNLSNVANEEVESSSNLNSHILNTLDKIIYNSDFLNITYNIDFDWTNLFKIYDVRFENNSGTLLERLLEYIKVVSKLCKAKLVIFVGLRNYLDEEEIKQLYQEIFGCKINVLFIESQENSKLNSENLFIIDKDRCLIIK